MSEPRELDESSPQNEPPTTTPHSGLSRRDFLRRATKEAVDTGTKIVPGAALTRKALGLDAKPNGDAPQTLVQRFAAWRNGRNGRRKDESA